MNVRQLFDKGNAGLGWAVMWRMVVFLVPLNLLGRFAAEEAAANPAAGILMLLALPIGGNVYLVPLAVPVVLFLWNWIGKHVLRTKLDFTTGRFIGWALYWRVALLQLAGIFALAVVLIPVTILAQNAADVSRMLVMAVAGLVLFPALIYWSLNITGFTLKRVAALIPAQTEAFAARAAAGAVTVRDYRVIFDPARYGMNWMPGVAYLATGLAGTLTYPAVQALFGAGFGYGMGEVLPVYVASWTIAGAGLAVILHRFRSAWQVIALFAGLMVVLRILESALLGLVEGAADLPLLDPQRLIVRAAFAILFGAGLLAGIRLIGPTIAGFAVGTGLAQLLHITLIYPPLEHLFHDVPLADLWTGQRFALDLVSTAVDAAITGAAFWWACDWHLNRRGFRLTQQGVIEPVAGKSNP